MSPTTVDKQLLEAAVRQQPAKSLDGVRSAALARFLSSGLPTTRTEAWKYTNLTPVAEISNQWLAGEREAHRRESPLPAEAGAIDAHWLVVRDGRIDDASVEATSRELDGKVLVRRLSTADVRREIYMDDAVASLNAALMEDALCISVAANVALDKPLALLIDDETQSAPSSSQIRLLITLGDNATAEFIELHLSRGPAEHFASLVCELDLAAAAKARYVKVQERAPNHLQVGRLNASLARDSRLEHASIDLGGRLVRNDVVASINEPGAHFSSAGLYLTEANQHVDNHVCADHRVGPATSNQVYRGIAAGKSRCVFNGKAVVREGADGTDAQQSNHSLLLSRQAEVDTKPELEIYAEDVKCSHGATVGQLDEKALFYLRSRGLDRDQAAQLLTRAFVNAVLDEIPVQAVRAYVDAATDRKLDRLIDDNLP